jgi:hypothetical protein
VKLVVVLAAGLVWCATASGAPPAPSDLAMLIHSHQAATYVYKDPAVSCSLYATGHCPTFRLTGVMCPSSTRCLVRYQLIDDLGNRGAYLSLTMRVWETARAIRWHSIAQQCSKAGTTISCAHLLHA